MSGSSPAVVRNRSIQETELRNRSLLKRRNSGTSGSSRRRSPAALPRVLSFERESTFERQNPRRSRWAPSRARTERFHRGSDSLSVLMCSSRAQVDAVDHVVRPEPPIRGGPEAVAVPGRADEPGPAAGELDQAEFARLGDQVVVEVWRVDRSVGRPFAQRWRIVRDANSVAVARPHVWIGSTTCRSRTRSGTRRRVRRVDAGRMGYATPARNTSCAVAGGPGIRSPAARPAPAGVDFHHGRHGIGGRAAAPRPRRRRTPAGRSAASASRPPRRGGWADAGASIPATSPESRNRAAQRQEHDQATPSLPARFQERHARRRQRQDRDQQTLPQRPRHPQAVQVRRHQSQREGHAEEEASAVF